MACQVARIEKPAVMSSSLRIVYMRMNREKIVTILRIIAYISLAIIVALIVLTWNEKEPSSIFLFESLFPILLFLAIPSFDRPFFRLKLFEKPDIKPKVLLWVYSLIASAFIIIMIIMPFSYFDAISDFPRLIAKNYSQINQASIQIVEEDYSPSELRVMTKDGTQLRILENAFRPINVSGKYTFIYLPRTKWVMDIIDENGVSLLKKTN